MVEHSPQILANEEKATTTTTTTTVIQTLFQLVGGLSPVTHKGLY